MPAAWADEEWRQGYMEATVEQDIAEQIAANRRSRGWSQRELAERMGTRQSAVSRLEDAAYGRHTIPTLVRVAHAFDCALRIALIPYSRLALETADTSDEALFVPSYTQEVGVG